MTEHTSRRGLLKAAAASAALIGLSRKALAADDKILIGYWPIAAGLPLYVGLDCHISGQKDHPTQRLQVCHGLATLFLVDVREGDGRRLTKESGHHGFADAHCPASDQGDPA